MMRTSFALTALALACTVLPAQAAIVNHADVGGFRTFQDTNTGLVWADLDNYWTGSGPSAPRTIAFASDYLFLTALQAAGFSWATSGEVASLIGGLPAGTITEQAALFSTMSTYFGGQDEYFWGFADAGGGLSTTVALNEASGWAVGATAAWDFETLNGRSFWAYIPAVVGGGGSVPEPASLALVGLALMAATSASRHKRQPTASA